MSIVYFDICSIPLFLMLLFICYTRKMTKGTTNQLFILLVFFSLISAVSDLGIEVLSNMAPLSEGGVILCTISTYIYLALRNGTLAILLLFLFSLTRTMFLLRKAWMKIGFFLPYGCILVLLVLNLFNHNVFTVTAQEGYSRGPIMYVFYAIALIYGLIGFIYCIYTRRYLPAHKWGALLMIYLLNHAAVVVQLFRPDLLLEMFCTAVGEMMVMLSIMRPEERMDSEVGMLSWASYQYDLRNIILSGEHVQIIVIWMKNSREIRNYLGDHNYNKYINEIEKGIRAIRWKRRQQMELYFERPGNIYLITNEIESGTENIEERLLLEIRSQIQTYAEIGVQLEPEICLIRCPEDLKEAKEIIRLGHQFQKIDGRKQTFFRASEIVRSKNFDIETNILEILDRALKENHIQVYYQPIYDVHSGGFHSAEALARIIDPEYGLISPGVFIPAAETEGFIIPVGDAVLDQVFRFISEHDMDALGLSCMEVNLSVAQCMESSLPDKILALQQKYGVDPKYVYLEITETTFENISEIMVENINRLIQMGYSFALDDYGIGYSSMQRVNRIPLKIIKIDKSMLDEASSVNGRIILEHTVHMMQSIGKQLVVEGAETDDVIHILKEMNCDYIQGFYFSKPLPEAEFMQFIEEQRKTK